MGRVEQEPDWSSEIDFEAAVRLDHTMASGDIFEVESLKLKAGKEIDGGELAQGQAAYGKACSRRSVLFGGDLSLFLAVFGFGAKGDGSGIDGRIREGGLRQGLAGATLADESPCSPDQEWEQDSRQAPALARPDGEEPAPRNVARFLARRSVDPIAGMAEPEEEPLPLRKCMLEADSLARPLVRAGWSLKETPIGAMHVDDAFWNLLGLGCARQPSLGWKGNGAGRTLQIRYVCQAGVEEFS